MKILITGGTGYIGRHLVEYWLESHHQITVLARNIDDNLFTQSIGCIEADITLQNDIQAAIIFLQPDVVIHCAALSKPNDCELNKEQCYLTNATATEYIIEACKAVGAKLIFLSTDFVFGNYGPYSEEDVCDPVNYYGQSKMIAEEKVRSVGIAYTIVRTVLVIGRKLEQQGNTFLHWVKECLEAGKTIRLYTDQQRSVTYVNDLCRGINTIIESNFEGTVHLSGEEIFTPYSLARQVAVYFNYSQELLQPVTRYDQLEPALRPENAVLKINKAKEQLAYSATPLSTILDEVFI